MNTEQYTPEQIKVAFEKAAKWDLLYDKIGKCYAEEGDEYFDEYNGEADLVTIGEIAATAFGYL